jgi:hypothetical protein
MSFDLKGRAPRSDTGKWFGLNNWDWRPLADYTFKVAPEIVQRSADADGNTPSAGYLEYVKDCEPFGGGKEFGWHTNDGFGLGDRDACLLGARLQAEIDAGHTAIYAIKFAGDLEMLPDVDCRTCHGTGERTPSHVLLASIGNFGSTLHSPSGNLVCNSCSGRGVRRPSATLYRFDADDVSRFTAFLRDCGGFVIW